ncbi:MAG: DUF1993 domain-containing protein [Caulobacteraceae bacterium]
MTVSLYTFVDLYSRALDTAAHVLAKGAQFAVANGATETEMLDWRLIDDMQPLRFQITVVVNYTRRWPARVAGLAIPEEIQSDLTLAQFQAAIADAKAGLAAMKPEQFAGRDAVPLTVAIGGDMKPTLPAGRWLTVFSTTNLYFHLSMAYAILRAKGVPIGKQDLFTGGL